MTVSVDRWLGIQYRKGEYTCSDFARQVWADLTGVDIAPALQGLLEGHDGRGLRRAHVRAFRALGGPISPCLVVMQRPGIPAHLGVFLRGGILHLTEAGAKFQPVHVATRFFKSYRFIECTL